MPPLLSFCQNLYSLDLVSHYHGVLFTDLGSSLGLVVIGTVVLVGVPMDATEQVATATVESWKHKDQGSKLVHENRTTIQDRWLNETFFFPSIKYTTIITAN